MADPLNLPQITGPFNISPPDPSQYYQGSKQQPSGVGTKTEGLAFFADKFLAGAAAGRKRAADHAWEQDQRARQSLMFAMQNLQSANIPDELKQQLMSQAGNTMARMVAGVGEGGDTGKKKTKKGGGQSSDQQDHPATHILDAIKGVANNLLGPGAPKEPVSTEDVNAITGKIFGAIGDPRNNSQTQAAELEKNLTNSLNVLRFANRNQPVTLETLNKSGFMSAMARLQQLNGGKPSPFVEGILAEAEGNSRVQEAERNPVTASTIERAHADAARLAADAAESQARADKDRAAAEAQRTYRDQKTGQLVRQNSDNTWTNIATGERITPSSDLTPLSRLSANGTRPVFKEGEQNGKKFLFQWNPENGKLEPAVDNNGRPINPRSPLGRAAQADPDHFKEKLSINEKYDAEVNGVETRINSGNIGNKAGQDQIKEIEERRERALGLVNKPPASVVPTPEDIAKRWLPSGANAAGASGSGGIKIISVTPAQ